MGTDQCKTIVVFSTISAQSHYSLTMAEEETPPIAAIAMAAASTKKAGRAYWSLAEKIDLCIEAERVVVASKTKSLRRFCKDKEEEDGRNLQPKQIRSWTKQLGSMRLALQNTRRKRTKLTCNKGRNSRLEKWSDRLLPWIESQQKDGKTVSIRLASVRAKRMDPTLRRMKRYTVFAIVRRYCRSKGITLRATTHKSQEDPSEKKELATAFLETTRSLLTQANRDKRFIINMDQTPVNLHDSNKKTLAKIGSKTVNAKEMKTSVGRVTVCLTVCADGTKLPPLIVYKGEPGKAVEREVTKYYPDALVCCVQPNAWTDERVALIWVDKVLAPYVATAPKGVVPYLFLDKYKCHYQGTTSQAIEQLGVEWDIIPGGCTGLVQPIDVAIGKPFKHRIRAWLEEWLMDNEGFDRVKPPVARQLVAEWTKKAWDSISTDIVWNSWRHEPFSYFPDEPTRDVVYESDEEYSSSEEEEEDDDDGEDTLEAVGV